MPNQAINQFPEVTTLLDGDLLYTVRGTTDHSVDASTFAGRILVQTTVIPTASVLTLGTTPFQIIPAPAASLVILPLRSVIYMTDGTVNYTTSTDLFLATETGADIAQFDISDASLTPQVNSALTGAVVKAGEALEANTAGVNPTTGDYDITVTVWYQLIDA